MFPRLLFYTIITLLFWRFDEDDGDYAPKDRHTGRRVKCYSVTAESILGTAGDDTADDCAEAIGAEDDPVLLRIAFKPEE